MHWYEIAEWSSVEDMYKYARANSLNLLSDYSSSFWSEYLENSERYDKMFMRMYKSYRYYMQNPYDKDNETIADITEDFIDAVYSHLLTNDKKYSELYRLKTLNTSTVNPLNDYDITTMNNETVIHEGSNVYGEREDGSTTNIGTRSDTLVSQIEGFNSSEYQDSNKNTNTLGAQENEESFSKGEQTDTDSYRDEIRKSSSRKGSTTNPYDNINKFTNAWNKYNFMEYVFKNICADLLLV